MVSKFLMVSGLACLLSVGFLGAGAQQKSTSDAKPEKLIDQKVNIDYRLNEIRNDNKQVSLSIKELKGSKKLVLFFFSEQCGVTFYYKSRIQAIQNEFEKKGFVFVGVRGGKRERPDKPLEIAETKYLKMPFVDDDRGELVNAFKVKCSVTFDVIDEDNKLRYRGGFDDNVDQKRVKSAFLKSALTQLSLGKPVKVKEGDAIGCAIIPIKTN